MRDLNTFHFKLHHDSGSTEMLQQLVIDKAEGDVVRPDRLSTTFVGVFAERFSVKISLVSIGEDNYMTNPLTGQWEKADLGVSPLGFFSPKRGIDAILSKVQQIAIMEQKAKQNVYYLSGTLEVQALRSLLGTTLDDGKIVVEFIINADTLLLQEVRIKGRVIPSDAEGVIRVVTLSAFNDPISISIPR